MLTPGDQRDLYELCILWQRDIDDLAHIDGRDPALSGAYMALDRLRSFIDQPPLTNPTVTARFLRTTAERQRVYDILVRTQPIQIDQFDQFGQA